MMWWMWFVSAVAALQIRSAFNRAQSSNGVHIVAGSRSGEGNVLLTAESAQRSKRYLSGLAWMRLSIAASSDNVDIVWKMRSNVKQTTLSRRAATNLSKGMLDYKNCK